MAGVNPSKYRHLRDVFYLKGEHLWAGRLPLGGSKLAATCDLNLVKGERLWGSLGEELSKGERLWGGGWAMGSGKVNGYGASGCSSPFLTFVVLYAMLLSDINQFCGVRRMGEVRYARSAAVVRCTERHHGGQPRYVRCSCQYQ